MKKIYIILTYTGTILSKIIKFYSKAEYAHVSISLDSKLKKMYSFGRLNAYNPFWGGFVHESKNYGTFKRFKKTYAKIFELEITDEQYNLLLSKINSFKKNRKKYKFNAIGLFANAFNIKFQKENSFYCSEFVKYILESSKIEHNLPFLAKPEDFNRISNKVVYSGILKEYVA